MMALMELSSPNLRSCSTVSLGDMITPSRSTTSILSPNPLKESFCWVRTVKYTSAKTARRKRKKAPPPRSTQRNTRGRGGAGMREGYFITDFLGLLAIGASMKDRCKKRSELGEEARRLLRWLLDP